MVTNFETVEERIRNAVTPMYNLAHIIKDIRRNDENYDVCYGCGEMVGQSNIMNNVL